VPVARHDHHRPYGTSNIWDCIQSDEFVSDTYVNTGSDGHIRPRCGS